MALVNKIDSNVSGLRVAEELGVIGVLTGSEVWTAYEPNEYSDFGAEVATVSRNPINPDRQRKKGTKTDVDATFGFNSDFTQTNMQDILQGFLFADFLPKGEEVPTQATGTTDLFDLASTTGFFVGSLVFVTGFVNAANNGLHVVSAVVADTTIAVIASTLVTETPPAGANIVVVGFDFAAGDLDVTIPGGGALPQYTATAKDLTQLGLNVGEFIFVGGDTAARAFTNVDGSANEVNNGWKRVRSIVAGIIEIDKSDYTMTVEASTTETIRVFFGRVLKNQTGTDIKRRTYQAERQMGAPDDALPTQIQAQYEKGGLANEFTWNVPRNDKVTCDLAFLALDEDRIDGPTALKAGTRPVLSSESPFNTSTDLKRSALTPVESGIENSVPLAGFLDEVTLAINNQGSPNKALGVTGAFDMSIGDFEVSGDITGYFTTFDAVDKVNTVADVSLDLIFYRANKGIAIDVPLLQLSDGRPAVEKDAPVTIPLGQEAVSGETIDPALNHTLMLVFFDYLPAKADTA